MQQLDIEPSHKNNLDLEIVGIQNEACQHAVDGAMGILGKRLPAPALELIAGTEITIGSGLIEAGGLTKAEEKKIFLDTDKNALSLQAAEDFLVQAGYLNINDWTKALPHLKDQPWSCLTYQLVHEFGHLIDGLSRGEPYKRLSEESSPTKYGATSPSESFAEAFAYWVFDLDLSKEAKTAVAKVLEI